MSETHQNPLQAILGSLWRTISGTFDFRGRSTRTEAWIFVISCGLIGPALTVALSVLTGETLRPEPTVASSISAILLIAPTTALIARRLHDIGRSGWWSALFLPAVILATFSENASPRIAGIAKYDFGWPVTVVLAAGIFALIAIFLAPTDDSPSPYGPNPRLRDVQ